MYQDGKVVIYWVKVGVSHYDIIGLLLFMEFCLDRNPKRAVVSGMVTSSYQDKFSRIKWEIAF